MVLLKITELFDIILEDSNVSRMKGYRKLYYTIFLPFIKVKMPICDLNKNFEISFICMVTEKF